MVETKGLLEESADRIEGYVKRKGSPKELLSELRKDAELVATCGSALEEMDLLFQFLEVMGVLGRYEVWILGEPPKKTQEEHVRRLVIERKERTVLSLFGIDRFCGCY